MVSRFPLLFLSFLLVATSFRCSFGDADGFETDDPLIRQVVGDNELLSADHHFTIFKRKYGKSYSTQEEHDYRFSVFKANLRLAKRHQKIDPSAVHGVTQFSDLTPREFRNFLGINRSLRLPSDAHKAPILPTNDLPTNFDWRDHGAVTPVKNQGFCKSCWAFSAIGALEGANFLSTGNLVSLSEQQFVDCIYKCDPEDKHKHKGGCKGGAMSTAFEYALRAGGVMRQEDYPYTATHDCGACKLDKTKIAAKVANYSVVSLDEDQIMANLVKNVSINAAFMRTYKGGVSCPYICLKRRRNHGMVLTGYGEAGIRRKDKPYWIIKNSWGNKWGESGYYRICRGRNVCGVNSRVLTVAALSIED